jgi:hypothetical protein
MEEGLRQWRPDAETKIGKSEAGEGTGAVEDRTTSPAAGHPKQKEGSKD